MTVTLPQSLNADLPELEDVKAQIKKEVMLDLMCHHVGRIESFNAVKQTATVKIVYKRTFFRQADGGQVKAELVPYPLLSDVPVMFLRGGQTSLRFPVAAGDECILMFADRDIDNWLATGDTESGCNTLRLHSVSDAIALVGLTSQENPIKEFSTVRSELVFGEGEERSIAFAGETGAGLERGAGKVIAGEKITIQNAETTLKTELQALIDQLTTLNGYLGNTLTAIKLITVTPGSLAGPSSVPLNAASFTSIDTNISNVTTALGNIKTKLGALLV